MFTGDLGRSIRNASPASELSYIGLLVRDIFNTDLNCKPLKPKSVQKLSTEDIDCRLEFAETMLELTERRPDLFSKLIWRDKALVRFGGIINKHNSHFWAEQSPSPYKLLKTS